MFASKKDEADELELQIKKVSSKAPDGGLAFTMLKPEEQIATLFKYAVIRLVEDRLEKQKEQSYPSSLLCFSSRVPYPFDAENSVRALRCAFGR